ncbi:MAG: hypothetical protein Tsb002_08570 [Wenzhouxiangellaceae bacterium]
MRSVERDGTGIDRTSMKQPRLMLLVSVLAALMTAPAMAQDGQIQAMHGSSGRVAVTISVDSHMLTGSAVPVDGYALFAVHRINTFVKSNTTDDPIIFAVGDGTGVITPNDNPTDMIYAVGDGTGAQIRAVGDGTGIIPDLSPTPTRQWGYVELVFNGCQSADAILYKAGNSGESSEHTVFPNVAVSGLASGIGCDRE